MTPSGAARKHINDGSQRINSRVTGARLPAGCDARDARVDDGKGTSQMNATDTTAEEPTIANADLWTKYFQDQWSAWAPAPSAAVAEGAAARVASFLTLVAAGPIAWLYSANASNVTPLRDEAPRIGHGEMESVEDSAA